MAASKVMKKALKPMKATKAMKTMKALKAMKAKAVKKAKPGMTQSQMDRVLSQNPDLAEQLKNAPRCKGLVYVSHTGNNGAIINLVYKNADGRLRLQLPLCGVLW